MVCGETDGERDTEQQHRVPEETERGQDKGSTRRSSKREDICREYDGIVQGSQTATATG